MNLTPEIVGAVVRHLLGGLAVWLGLDGYLDDQMLSAAAGAVGVLVIIGWSIWQKARAKEAAAAPTASPRDARFGSLAWPLLLLLPLFLLGCAGNLTERQTAYDIVGKAEAALVVALRVVETPEVPAEVKRHVKLGAQVLTEATGAYVEAVKRGIGVDTAAAAAVSAIANLTGYLVRQGYLKEARGDPGPGLLSAVLCPLPSGTECPA